MAENFGKNGKGWRTFGGTIFQPVRGLQRFLVAQVSNLCGSWRHRFPTCAVPGGTGFQPVRFLVAQVFNLCLFNRIGRIALAQGWV
jgi:hypothetical protein